MLKRLCHLIDLAEGILALRADDSRVMLDLVELLRAAWRAGFFVRWGLSFHSISYILAASIFVGRVLIGPWVAVKLTPFTKMADQ